MELADYYDVITDCQLFAGIAQQDMGEALRLYDPRVRDYAAGELVVRMGEEVTCAGVVLEGSVEGSFASEAYDQVDMERFCVGADFGEGLACLGGASPMQVRAATDCKILFLNVRGLLLGSGCGEVAHRLMANLVFSLAAKSLFLNRKVRIVSQRRLRDRVLMYLRGLPALSDGAVVVPLNGTELAQYLNVNRSALSRELGRMADDGVIRTEGGRTYLL